MERQVGSKRTNPDELTQVSDSGESASLTTLPLQVRRVYEKNSDLNLRPGKQPTSADRCPTTRAPFRYNLCGIQ
ncbi:hypothetical protein NJ56_10835 [Yersinia ruckeri]|nr:hypothetical protein NJ56_10835 [Yersinia ruckeri]